MPCSVYIGPLNYDSKLLVLHGGMLGGIPLDPNFDSNLLARRTEGYSPSDICMVLQAAALYSLMET